jgi:Na+/proline symporter
MVMTEVAKAVEHPASIPANPLFIPSCVLAVGGWVAIFFFYAPALPAFTFVAICILWAAYRIPFAITKENLSTFFLYERKMPRREFVGTLVTTNIGFFSSVAFSTLLIASMGVGPAVISVLFWLAGLYAFSTQVDKLIPFFKKGSTLHEYIGVSFGVSARQAATLAFVSSLVTFLLYIASVGVEIKFASDVFSNVTAVEPHLLAGLLCISGIFYVALAGYRGVVSTDRLRMWAVLVGAFTILIFCGLYISMEPINWPKGYFSAQNLTVGSAPVVLLSILVLLGLYQFCVMDMWERCIAIVNNPHLIEGADEPTEVARASASIRKMLVRDSVLPFTFLFCAWYSIGLLSVAQNWTTDPNEIIPILFQKIALFAATQPTAGYLIESLVMLCFLSAALSTVDGFLIAAVQTVVFDWFGVKPNTIGKEGGFSGTGALILSRSLILFCGLLAVAIAFMSFDLLSFWVSMYSLMLSFFPPIAIALTTPSKRRPNAWVTGFAIGLGSLSALGFAVYGTFIRPDTTVSSVAPFFAILVSAAVMGLGMLRRG